MEAASEQPARESGISTVLSGFRIFDVSAMKCTPHCTMMSDFTLVASMRELQQVAADVGDAMEDFRRLVIMRQDDRVACFFRSLIALIEGAINGHSIGGMTL